MKSAVFQTLISKFSLVPLSHLGFAFSNSPHLALLHSAGASSAFPLSSPLPFSSYRKAKTKVCWDIENCAVPACAKAQLVSGRIIRAVHSAGIIGSVAIMAFGDVALVSHNIRKAFTSTGVCHSHVPHCGKNSSDSSLMAYIMGWIGENPPPANIFLISGDSDFAPFLQELKMKNYNTLLATTVILLRFCKSSRWRTTTHSLLPQIMLPMPFAMLRIIS